MRQTRADLQRELDRLRGEVAARGDALAALAALAALPLPVEADWGSYHHQAAIRLAWIARGLAQAARYSTPADLGFIASQARALAAEGLGYVPDPAALPKQVRDRGLSVVTEGSPPR